MNIRGVKIVGMYLIILIPVGRKRHEKHKNNHWRLQYQCAIVPPSYSDLSLKKFLTDFEMQAIFCLGYFSTSEIMKLFELQMF